MASRFFRSSSLQTQRKLCNLIIMKKLQCLGFIAEDRPNLAQFFITTMCNPCGELPLSVFSATWEGSLDLASVPPEPCVKRGFCTFSSLSNDSRRQASLLKR